jgi:hypothetical protein
MKNLFFAVQFILYSLSSVASSGDIPLSAYYDQSKKVVRLKWQPDQNLNQSFIIQRSKNNLHWEEIGKVIASRNIESFTDLKPDPSANHYRLKIVNSNGSPVFTPSILVIIGNSANSWVMYPVPVGAVLNLKYTGSEMITGALTITIQNSSGQNLSRLRSSTTSRTIQVPVHNLGRGIYDVKIFVSNRLIWNQRFVK